MKYPTRSPNRSWKTIKSHGIILYRIHNNAFEYLMVCRRHTFSFVDYILGKYTETDLQYIMQLICNMTYAERKLIRTKDYRHLWDRMYMTTRKAEGVFYEQVKQKFDKGLHTFLLLEKKLPCLWKYPEWGFPKGKLNGENEPSLKCAIRELEEETMIKQNMYVIDQNILPFEEEFIGTNGHKYTNVFYVGSIDSSISTELNTNHTSHTSNTCNPCIPFIDTRNLNQVREISRIEWFSLKQANHVVRFHERSKLYLLNELEKVLRKKHNFPKRVYENRNQQHHHRYHKHHNGHQSYTRETLHST